MPVNGGTISTDWDGGQITVEPTEPTYAGSIQDFWVETEIEDEHLVLPAGEVYARDGDRLTYQSWDQMTKKNKRISATQTRFDEYESITFESSDEKVAKVYPDGRIAHISNGEVIISAVSQRGASSQCLVLKDESINYVESFVGGIMNSARKDATDAVMDRIDGKTPAVAMPIFSTQDHSTPTYTRNTNCWAADLDLTPISPWNSHNSYRRAGVLISPCHILCAAHYPIDDDSTIRFIDASNNVITRTMETMIVHPDYDEPSPDYDIAIGVLNNDVPAGIGHVKILPDDWEDYLPTNGTDIPILTTDDKEEAIVRDLSDLSLDSRAYYDGSSNPIRSPFKGSIWIGDSGNPVFMILDGQLVLLCVHTFPNGGWAVHETIADINQMMTDLGGGYQLTEFDLSNYINFGDQ